MDPYGEQQEEPMAVEVNRVKKLLNELQLQVVVDVSNVEVLKNLQ